MIFPICRTNSLLHSLTRTMEAHLRNFQCARCEIVLKVDEEAKEPIGMCKFQSSFDLGRPFYSLWAQPLPRMRRLFCLKGIGVRERMLSQLQDRNANRWKTWAEPNERRPHEGRSLLRSKLLNADYWSVSLSRDFFQDGDSCPPIVKDVVNHWNPRATRFQCYCVSSKNHLIFKWNAFLACCGSTLCKSCLLKDVMTVAIDRDNQETSEQYQKITCPFCSEKITLESDFVSVNVVFQTILQRYEVSSKAFRSAKKLSFSEGLWQMSHSPGKVQVFHVPGKKN